MSLDVLFIATKGPVKPTDVRASESQGFDCVLVSFMKFRFSSKYLDKRYA